MLTRIVLLSVILRLTSAFYQGDAIQVLPGIHDQVSYHALACRVLSGDGFSFAIDWWPATRAGTPTSHWSFLYTLYLVLVYGLFGEHPLAARLIQSAVSGVVHPWLSWRIGRRLFGSEAGLASALIAAIYAYFVFYAGSLMTESFYILSILWSFDLVTRMTNRGRIETVKWNWEPWLLLGIALGTAVLLRQTFLLFLPFLCVWLWWRTRGAQDGETSLPTCRSPLTGLLIVASVVTAMILPWTIRNYFTFGRFVLLNSNAGYAFFWGNHPFHGTDFVPILPAHGPAYRELIPSRLLSLNEAALDQALLLEGLRNVGENPKRYLLLSLSRAREYFKFWPSAESSFSSNLTRTLSFGLFLPFMALGLWISIMRYSPHGVHGEPSQEFSAGDPGSKLAPLYLFIAIYSLIHLMSWSLIRYRLPVDAVLVLFAGSGLLQLVHRLPSAVRTCAAPQRQSGKGAA